MLGPHRKHQAIAVLSLVLVLALLPLTPSSAAPQLDPRDPPTLPELARGTAATARLSETNGNRTYQFVPHLVQVVQTGTDSVAVTYEVGIPSQYLSEDGSGRSGIGSLDLFPFPAFAASENASECDSTVSVCATLTLYFTKISNHGWYQYTTNRWTRSDPAVAWSNAKLKAGCNAEWYPGTGRCATIVTRNIGVPTSATTYSYTPWFAGSSNQVDLDGFNGIAGYQSITLKRGSSTWQFGFCVSHGGENGMIIGCY